MGTYKKSNLINAGSEIIPITFSFDGLIIGQNEIIESEQAHSNRTAEFEKIQDNRHETYLAILGKLKKN